MLQKQTTRSRSHSVSFYIRQLMRRYLQVGNDFSCHPKGLDLYVSKRARSSIAMLFGHY